MAENQQRSSHAANHVTSGNNQPTPPTHVVVDPPFPPSNSQPCPTDHSGQPEEKPLPRFIRPEWVIVYVTVAYSLITLLMWRTIKRQANIMDAQAKDAKESDVQTFAVLKEQTDNATISAKAATVTALAADESAKAALAQIEVMKQQASVMERQTGILETSVTIAKKSADAFVNSERARLAVTYSETEPSVFRFHAKNSGRSPALIKFALVRFHALNSDESLPRKPDYLNEEEDWSGSEEWVLPDQPAELRINDVYERMDLSDTSVQVPDDVREHLKTGKSSAWFYGYVRYRESISGDDKFTRFIYACYFTTSEGVILIRENRNAYNLET